MSPDPPKHEDEKEEQPLQSVYNTKTQRPPTINPVQEAYSHHLKQPQQNSSSRTSNTSKDGLDEETADFFDGLSKLNNYGCFYQSEAQKFTTSFNSSSNKSPLVQEVVETSPVTQIDPRVQPMDSSDSGLSSIDAASDNDVITRSSSIFSSKSLLETKSQPPPSMFLITPEKDDGKDVNEEDVLHDLEEISLDTKSQHKIEVRWSLGWLPNLRFNLSFIVAVAFALLLLEIPQWRNNIEN